MIYDTSQRFAPAVVREESNLIEPDTGQDECSIATFALDLALFQVRRLNDVLKERPNGFLAIVVQVVLPRMTFFRRLVR